MTASLTPNREAVLSALWWLYEGATFYVFLANTSAAASPPSLAGNIDAWFFPVNYTLSNDFDVFVTGGIAAYDAVIEGRAKLPQLVIALSYDATVTYTDVLFYAIPVISPGASAPTHAFPFVGVIHESSPVTLLAAETKTYNVDLFAELI